MRCTWYAVAVLLLLSVFVQADPFIVPPESVLPPEDWTTAFPYQRNAMIDFATDPHTWPFDANAGAPARELSPSVGNYILEGTHDPDYYDSDYLVWVPDQMQWFDTHPAAGDRQGLIGVSNQENVEFTLNYHLDNVPTRNPVKHMWIEIEYYYSGTGTWSAAIVPSIGKLTEAAVDQVQLQDGWYRWNGWAELKPNPLWEDIFVTVSTNPTASGTLLVDYIHVATECVPEPGTMALFGIGGVALVLLRRRRAA